MNMNQYEQCAKVRCMCTRELITEKCMTECGGCRFSVAINILPCKSMTWNLVSLCRNDSQTYFV